MVFSWIDVEKERLKVNYKVLKLTEFSLWLLTKVIGGEPKFFQAAFADAEIQIKQAFQTQLKIRSHFILYLCMHVTAHGCLQTQRLALTQLHGKKKKTNKWVSLA